MKSHPAAAAAALAALICLSQSLFAAEPTKDSLATVKKSVAENKAVLVDVREKAEWDDGHVAGAVLLPLSVLKGDVSAEELKKRLPQDRIVYTHCAVGIRSCSAADVLVKYGYDVRPLKPGYKDLIAAGFKKGAD